MRESIKVLWVVVFIFSASAAAISWLVGGIKDIPDSADSFMGYFCPLLAVLAIAAFLIIHFRPDKVPDYLTAQFGTFFNRNGFCFNLRTNVVDGVCYFELFFQNQRDKRCIGRVAFQPAGGIFIGRANIDPITVKIKCKPAGYGVVKIAVAIPGELQGEKQAFEVGADVSYPDGKGRQLRFADGIVLRANSQFRDITRTAMTTGLLLTGHITYSTPAHVKLKLPKKVAKALFIPATPEVIILWKLGDPPLEALD